MAIIRVDRDGDGLGTRANDTIYGDRRTNLLYGSSGNDRLYGSGGNDHLDGGTGRDTLTGGAGYDDFYFGTRPKKGVIDVITDYNKKYDSILLSSDIFKGLGSANTWMSDSAFWQGSKAHDADDRIIYNPKNGLVYYDADGIGSKGAVAFVKVGKGKTMSASDFWVDEF